MVQREVVGYQKMVATWPNSICGQRYSASGQEGRNNLIEKISCCECANSKNEKKTKAVVSPCKLVAAREEVVG